MTNAKRKKIMHIRDPSVKRPDNVLAAAGKF